MPIFEFHCQDCKTQFNKMISNADKDHVRCPQCDSGNIKQLLSLFSTGKAKASNNSNACDGCMRRTAG